MFSRIREAARIITYREPQRGPDITIVERVEPSVTTAGKLISNLIEVFAVIYVIGHVAGPLGSRLERLVPGRSIALTTIAGAIGALLMLIVGWIRADIEHKIRSHVNLGDALAPFFGHRLDNTFRVLRG